VNAVDSVLQYLSKFLKTEPPRNRLFVSISIKHAKKNYDSSDLNDYYGGLDRRATHNWLNFGQQPNRFEFSAEQK
jgi:hypothetical protein